MHKENKVPALSGVVGFFDDPGSLTEAAAKVRDSSYKHFDCYTPYAVHGLEHAQGLPRSKVPYVTGIFAFTGTATAFAWQYAASVTWWPHIIGGKPMNSLPAFVPIIFELSVLFGGIATFFGMLAFNRLPNLKKKAFDPSITNNRFAIMIDNPNAEIDDEEEHVAFSPEQAEQFLKSVGAKDVRKVYNEGWFS
jgi:hypothetical protein